MKTLLLIFMLMLFTTVWTSAGTQGILEGRVTDASTKENLVSVTVQIVGTSIGTVTNIDGFYRLNNVRAGVYDIKYTILGYKSVILKNVTVYADLRTRMDVQLDQSSVELSVVEIFSQKPLIQKDQPSTAFSIGEIKLDKLPVTTFQEILSLQPGVTLEGNVRGGKTNEVIYLIDGVPVQDYVAGGLGTELPKSSIGGMTIYTGGFEAEYGNAMSGVINVITKGGDNTHKMSFRFEKDNWIPSKWNKQVDQHNEGEFSLGGPVIPNTLFYLTATTVRFSNTRWWQDMNKYFSSPNSAELSGMAKLDYLASESSKLTGQGIYSYKDWHDYEYSWRYNLDGLPRRKSLSLRGVITLTQTISDRSAFSLSFTHFYMQNRFGEDTKAEIEIQPYHYDIFLRYVVGGKKNWWANIQQLVQTIKGDFTSQLDDVQLLKSGFEINFYDIFYDLVKFEPQRTYFGKPIENAPLLNFSNLYEYFPRSGSIYVQDKFRFSLDGSILSLGLRWDFLDPRAERPLVEFIPSSNNEFKQQVVGYKKTVMKHAFSPRVAFAAPMGPNSMFFVNFGYYFQYPLFEYLYTGINPPQIQSGARSVLTGNPDLEPERTIAWEIGYKHAVTENYVGSITFFRKNVKNQIDSKTLIPFDSKAGGDYGFAQYVNNANAEAQGIEFVLSRERDEMLSGSFSYSFMYTEGSSNVANQSINQAQWGFPIKAVSFPLSWDQRHSVKLDIETTLPYKIIANGIIWFNSPKPYTYFPTRDGFTPLDSSKDFLPNNSRMRNVLFGNLKLSRNFSFDSNNDISLTVYVDARNVFNTKNVKWIDSNGRIGGELSDPSAYYELRRVRVGGSVTF
ncbi:MAG: TonB-dependent receptor [Bacteroidetes bacterium]|nr:TonB-dependent receptor [Bacteroidota bacterium]